MPTPSFIFSYWIKGYPGGWRRVTHTLSVTQDLPVIQAEMATMPTLYVAGANVNKTKKSKKTNSWKPKQYGRSN